VVVLLDQLFIRSIDMRLLFIIFLCSMWLIPAGAQQQTSPSVPQTYEAGCFNGVIGIRPKNKGPAKVLRLLLNGVQEVPCVSKNPITFTQLSLPYIGENGAGVSVVGMVDFKQPSAAKNGKTDLVMMVGTFQENKATRTKSGNSV
jgi:hypothetical protein